MDYDEQLFARMYNLIRVSGKCMFLGEKNFSQILIDNPQSIEIIWIIR